MSLEPSKEYPRIKRRHHPIHDRGGAMIGWRENQAKPLSPKKKGGEGGWFFDRVLPRDKTTDLVSRDKETLSPHERGRTAVAVNLERRTNQSCAGPDALWGPGLPI